MRKIRRLNCTVANFSDMYVAVILANDFNKCLSSKC